MGEKMIRAAMEIYLKEEIENNNQLAGWWGEQWLLVDKCPDGLVESYQNEQKKYDAVKNALENVLVFLNSIKV